MLNRILVLVGSNATALYAAGRLVEGFRIPLELPELLVGGVVLTLINATLRPIARLLLFPLTLLTIGLFGLVINAGTIYLLDYLLESITIAGLRPLAEGTIVVTLVGTLCQFLLPSNSSSRSPS